VTGTPVLRILIVDDIPESRDNIERLLNFEPDFRVVGKAARGEEGIEQALRLQPHVVLVDQTLPDRDGVEVAAAITARAPGIGVIVLGLDQDPDMLRRAMLAGAREYLTKPFAYEELVDAVRRVGRLANPHAATFGVAFSPPRIEMPSSPLPLGRNGELVAVLGSKGGVGRTFIATNLAVLLQQRFGLEVVLVDADLLRGDVAVLLNLSPQRSWTDVARVPAGMVDAEIVRELLTRHASGVRVLLAPGSLEEAERIQPSRVPEVLQELRRVADFVIVDTRGGYDEYTLACADSATTLLWVLTLEMTAIKDTRIFLELSSRLGYQDKRTLFLVNQVNAGSGLTPDEVEETLRIALPVRIPFDPSAVIRSINEGTPLAWNNRQHRIVTEIERLAQLLQEDQEASAREPARRRRFGFPKLRNGSAR